MHAADAALLDGCVDGQILHLPLPQHGDGAGELEGSQTGLGGVALEIGEKLHHVDVGRVKTVLARRRILRLTHHIDASNIDIRRHCHRALEPLTSVERQHYEHRR